MARTSTVLALVIVLLLGAGCGSGGDPTPPPRPPDLSFFTQAGQTGACWGVTLATASSGTTVAVGSFQATATFGAGETAATTLTAQGTQDTFVAKYTRRGSLMWVRQLLGGVAAAQDVTVSPSGQITVVGSFWTAVTFDPDGPNETTLTVWPGDDALGFEDGFVARYSATGTFLGATHVSGPGQTEVLGITSRSDNSIVVCGLLANTVVFGTGQANETSLTATGIFDGYLAAYTTTGALLWARGLTSDATGRSLLWSVSSASNGSLAAIGEFKVEVTLGTETLLSNAGSTDIHLSYWNPNGLFDWALAIGGPNDEQARGTVIASDGHIGLVGAFSGTVTFGTIGGLPTAETSAGGMDGLVASYTNSGTLRWTETVGGTANDFAYDITADDHNAFQIVGWFNGEATLGAGQTGERTLTSSGTDDDEVFVAEYDTLGILTWAERFGGTGFDFATGVASQPNGDVVFTGSFVGDATLGADPEIFSSVGDRDAYFIRTKPD